MASSPSSKGKGSKVNEKTVTPRKRRKHKVVAKVNEMDYTGSHESRLNIPQKPYMVTTPSGVRVILPFVRNDAHKLPSKANSAKSKKQVGIFKSPAGKGSKSPMKKNSPMSHGKEKSPKRKDRTRVLDYSRKQRIHDRDDNSEFPCSMTTRSHASNKKELNVKRKAKGDSTIKKKHAKKAVVRSIKNKKSDPAPRSKCVKVVWRKQFPGKRVRISAVMKRIEESEYADLEFKINFLMLTSKDTWKGIDQGDTFYSGSITFLTLLYADIIECKKLDVERRRPAISVWNMENLCHREYLELSDGGFGTWQLIRDDGIQKEKPLYVFTERSEIPKISAKSKLKDYKDQIRAKLNEILAQKQIAEFIIEKAISDFPADLDLRTLDMEFHTPNKITVHHNHQEDQASKDNDQSLITTEGLQLVPRIPLETSQYWNSPRTHIELDDTLNNYGKKKEFNAYEIPKMDIDMANKRESKLGDSLRSPYVKRIVAIDALETSLEKKICAWINAAIEPICQPVFETSTGVVSLRGRIESLCARTEIYSNVIDNWAALLNHEERFRSMTSPQRLFMHSAILPKVMVDEDTSDQVKLKLFTDNLLAAVGGDDDLLSFKSIDLMLRNKYTAKLLLSDINVRRSLVIADCEKFNVLDVKERSRLLQYADANRETRLASI
ncbi:hypothetical protein L6452_01868 [Arctium lappa]|uniref:Uncharacterized protein n=1 Tax=Arctium lappa TaxID=4217 RepID=A0ACB9FJ56_ARCLA|nr:hypothetical protein L6452_01868 [Arctium lappa]